MVNCACSYFPHFLYGPLDSFRQKGAEPVNGNFSSSISVIVVNDVGYADMTGVLIITYSILIYFLNASYCCDGKTEFSRLN